jgi:hypothetical protein
MRKDTEDGARRRRDLARAAAWAVACVAATALLPARLEAQPRAPKRVEAQRLVQNIELDGQLLETAWMRAPINDFRRYRPRTGAPSQRTDVWVAYDDEALYVAARLRESDSTLVSTVLGRRDEELASDWFSVALDPNGDGRTGFLFSVNPSGSFRDAALYDDGRIDYTWEAAWQRKSLVDSLGWTVEMRIPFSRLRFTARDEYQWGINFARQILHTGEELVYAGSLAKVSRFGTLEGIAGIEGGSRLQLVPYVVGSLHSYQATPDDPFNTGREYDWSAGGDLRYGFPSGLTLDATINPDFGQVEVDPAVINLTAYETFYQEKRPFFANSATLFRSTFVKGAEFFYSRRIGRSPQGRDPRDIQLSHEGFSAIPEQTTILGATKLLGRLGNALPFGAMVALTQEEQATIDSAGTIFTEPVEPMTVYSVVRGRYEPRSEGYDVGVLATGVVRRLGETRLADIMNRNAFTGAIDFSAPLTSDDDWMLRGWAGASAVSGTPRQMLRLQRSSQRYFQRPDADHLAIDSFATSLAGWAGGLRAAREEGALTASLGVTAYSPGFEVNDLGYSRYADYIDAEATLGYSLYELSDLLSELSLDLVANNELDFGGDRTGTSIGASASTLLANQWSASTSLTWRASAVDVRATRGGPAMISPSGWDASLTLGSDPRNDLTASLTTNVGGDAFGSHTLGLGGELVWRPAESVMLSIAPWIDRSTWEAAYFATVRDERATQTYGSRYVFATLDQKNTSVDIRFDLVLTPTLSLQLYAQPFFGDVAYANYRELARARSDEFLRYGENGSSFTDVDGEFTIDPDGNGPADEFSLFDSNFNYESLRGTAVLRWEYLPGSTVYLAWTQSRYRYDDRWQAYFNPGGTSLMRIQPDNVFHLKFSYLIGS